MRIRDMNEKPIKGNMNHLPMTPKSNVKIHNESPKKIDTDKYIVKNKKDNAKFRIIGRRGS